MNYLDLLPNDIMKIINRKVEKAHIIERRIERKNNRKMNREQKQVADRKRDIFEKFVLLYQKHLRDKYLKRVQDDFPDWSNYLSMEIEKAYMYGDVKHEFIYKMILSGFE